MATTVPQLTQNITINFQQLAVDVNGTVTGGTNHSLSGKAQSLRVSHRRRTAEITALDGGIVNNVPIRDEWTIEAEQIRRSGGGTSANPLQNIAMGTNGSDYARLILVMGTAAATTLTTWTYDGVITEYEVNAQDPNVIDRMVLVSMDTGAANPSYVHS